MTLPRQCRWYYSQLPTPLGVGVEVTGATHSQPNPVDTVREAVWA